MLINSCNILENSENEILRESCDLQDKRKATLFLNPGNATLDNSIHLSVIDCKDQLETTEPGNVFVADSDHGKAKIDDTCVSFKWVSTDTLKVTYDSLLRTFHKETKIKDVYIIYETK